MHPGTIRSTVVNLILTSLSHKIMSSSISSFFSSFLPVLHADATEEKPEEKALSESEQPEAEGVPAEAEEEEEPEDVSIL
jgi:hypothetical protein